MVTIDMEDTIVIKRMVDLAGLSIEDLEDYLLDLGKEIDKVNNIIKNKHKARKGADSIFR